MELGNSKVTYHVRSMFYFNVIFLPFKIFNILTTSNAYYKRSCDSIELKFATHINESVIKIVTYAFFQSACRSCAIIKRK